VGMQEFRSDPPMLLLFLSSFASFRPEETVTLLRENIVTQSLTTFLWCQR
jgi:hypothetical protein